MPALRAVLVRGVRLGAALAAVAVVPSCGGSSGTSSSPPPPPVASALDFILIPMVNRQTVVEFDWTGSGASSYTLEVGSSSGQSDVGVFDVAGAAASYTWNGAPVGNLYARVKGRQGATLGAASNEVLVGSIDARDMIDALIFGSGPLAVAGNAAGPFVQDRMDGWQPGVTIEVVLGESVPTAAATSVERTVEQIGPATRGEVRAQLVGRRPDPLSPPRPGQVTVAMLAAEKTIEECHCDDCVGCARTWHLGSFIQRTQIFLSSTTAHASAPAHEIGHAIGLSHIISAAGVRPAFTMGLTTDAQFAAQSRLEVLDPATIRMLETLYGAGLTAGASRRQVEALGLVPSEPSGIDPRPRVALKTIRDGLETIVIRPLCRAQP